MTNDNSKIECINISEDQLSMPLWKILLQTHMYVLFYDEFIMSAISSSSYDKMMDILLKISTYPDDLRLPLEVRYMLHSIKENAKIIFTHDRSRQLTILAGMDINKQLFLEECYPKPYVKHLPEEVRRLIVSEYFCTHMSYNLRVLRMAIERHLLEEMPEDIRASFLKIFDKDAKK